jgi:dienelactone hydrolase
MRRLLPLFLLALGLSADIPDVDQRGRTLRDPGTPRALVTVTNAADWPAQVQLIRNQIQYACGLYPAPELTPLKAQVFGRIERDGYSVEKVHFQPFPGLYVAGNLYRPLGKGNGPFPAVLNLHGHDEAGRFQAAAVARCVQLARMGMVAFNCDLLGYNDSAQFSPRNADGSLVRPKHYDNHTALFADPANQLWGLSLAGVQLWSSIRAVDFLQALPDVDRAKIGCAGESAGGTHALLLAALDQWVQVIALAGPATPGACACENAPGLRVEFSNPDFAAALAPRPLLLLGGAQEGAKSPLGGEGSAVAGVYRLLGAEDKFRAVSVEGGQNFSQTARETAYAWFAHGLQWQATTDKIPELPYTPEPEAALRVFPDGKYPADALSEAQFTSAWIAARKERLLALEPKDAKAFAQLDQLTRQYWQYQLQIDFSILKPGGVVSEWAVGRPGKGDRIEKQLMVLDDEHPPKLMVIIAHPQGRAAIGPGGARERLAAMLLAKGYGVLGLDLYQTGKAREEAVVRRSPFTNFFSAYNRTVIQQRVQDLCTANMYAKSVLRAQRVAIVADGEAGLWGLLAAIAPDALLADANAVDASNDTTWLDPERFFPGARLLGGPAAIAAIAAPRPLWIHHTGGAFDAGWIKEAYQATGHPDRLRVQADSPLDKDILAWLEPLAAP